MLYNNIKQLREAAGLSRKELAEKTGIRYTRITDYENSYIPIGNMTVENLSKIADALGVSLDELCRPPETKKTE